MKVLIADNDSTSRLFVKTHLMQWGYEVVEAINGNEINAIVFQKSPPRILIIDIMLSDINVLELCATIQNQKDSPLIYVLLLLSSCHQEDMSNALENGVHNIHVKPLTRDQLKSYVSVGKQLVTYDDQIKNYEKQIERSSRIDELTKIPNRHYLLECATNEFNRAFRYARPMSVLLLDIDHFRKINETYGHDAGDNILATLAESCQNDLRQNDLIGRIGGEEFAIILPETEIDCAIEVAERIRISIEQKTIHVNNHSIRLTVSIGIAILWYEDRAFEDILSRAGDALQCAKIAGRNCVLSGGH